VALDEAHLIAAARYVALHPNEQTGRAGVRLALGPGARAHLAGRDDGPVRVALLIDRVGRFADLMTADTDVSLFAALRDAEGKRLIDVDIEPPLHFFLLRRDGLYDLAAQRYLV